ncbi:MAG TPA: acetoin utilization protein AcuC [Nitrososphaerales archaeon]|nr:acetoin utilization protein AcuC [Nitrososphaerales archaeon]
MCRVCVVKGDGLLKYSFPPPHPFNSVRAVRFWEELARQELGDIEVEPELAGEESLELFHDKGHIESVRKSSIVGEGCLDDGDTPAFKGVFEAAEFTVGSTVSCVERVLSGEVDHGFNPVGGLHHARPDRSAGFCVFNDIGVAIELLRHRGVARVLYVDIDVHHGDGIFYPYEYDSEVFIFDVHEDGHFLYPGTGSELEKGEGRAEGTKMNIPLLPGEGDERIKDILSRLEEFAAHAKPEFIILQCGADSFAGDPIGGLKFSKKFHSSVAKSLHRIAHAECGGRLVALGGGGYDPDNCASAWTSVVRCLVDGPDN